ncbi:MAG: hypothetical protein C0504_07770 [Candidatus Solibacter sp.]|nr:hypothetical protein [Candidatus Solibacter sp.]
MATGKTLASVSRNIREAIEFHLDGLRHEGLPIPEPSFGRGRKAAVRSTPDYSARSRFRRGILAGRVTMLTSATVGSEKNRPWQAL